MQNQPTPIFVECVGDPEYYYSDDEDKKDENYDPDDKSLKVFTFDKLPGQCAIFKIQVGELKCRLNYGIWGLTVSKLTSFVDALQNNTTCELSFRPGANQESFICTRNGTTTFSVWGAGGDNPISFDISIPNQYCLDAFVKLLPK